MNKKILNFALLIIVILIVIIFSTMIYYMITPNKASNSIYDDVQKTSNTDTTLKDEVQSTVAQTISVDDDEFKKIYPFTGAFPRIDIMPFIFVKEDITTFSNEQILSLAFSKVTKDDWADSYVSEIEPVSIPASILDGYIKDIFGANVQYQKANFSNKNYSLNKDGNPHTSSAEVTYVPETDTYTIDLTEGDGIGENYVYMFEPTVSKIHNNIEIEIPYAYVVYADNVYETPDFPYTVYANYNVEAKTFEDELGSATEIGDFTEDPLEDLIQKNLSKMRKLRLIYSMSEDGTELILKEIKK